MTAGVNSGWYSGGSSMAEPGGVFISLSTEILLKILEL